MRQVIVLVTPVAIENAGWKFYLLFCIMNALGFPFVYFFLPEVLLHILWLNEFANPVTRLKARHWRRSTTSLRMLRSDSAWKRDSLELWKVWILVGQTPLQKAQFWNLRSWHSLGKSSRHQTGFKCSSPCFRHGCREVLS